MNSRGMVMPSGMPGMDGAFMSPPQAAEPELAGFKYTPQSIVMAAGQYREISPIIAPLLTSSGGVRFHTEPAELPPGLQFDPCSGTFWGSPSPPNRRDEGTAGFY